MWTVDYSLSSNKYLYPYSSVTLRMKKQQYTLLFFKEESIILFEMWIIQSCHSAKKRAECMISTYGSNKAKHLILKAKITRIACSLKREETSQDKSNSYLQLGSIIFVKITVIYRLFIESSLFFNAMYVPYPFFREGLLSVGLNQEQKTKSSYLSNKEPWSKHSKWKWWKHQKQIYFLHFNGNEWGYGWSKSRSYQQSEGG